VTSIIALMPLKNWLQNLQHAQRNPHPDSRLFYTCVDERWSL